MAKFRNLRFEETLDDIEEYIDVHGLGEGDPLPPERKMAEELMISRGTLRAALGILEQEGRVYRIQGKGNFVAPEPYSVDFSEMSSFSESEKKKGNAVTSELLAFQTLDAGGMLAKELEIEIEEQVYRIFRVRKINGRPVVLENAYIPCKYAPELGRYNLEEESLYEILSIEYGIDILDQDIEIKLSTAYEKEAASLEINEGDIVFVEKGLARDMSGRPVEYSQRVLVGKYSEYRTHIGSNDNVLFLDELKLRYLYDQGTERIEREEFKTYEESYWSRVRYLLQRERENNRKISFLFEQRDSEKLYDTVLPFADYVFLNCDDRETCESRVKKALERDIQSVVVIHKDRFQMCTKEETQIIYSEPFETNEMELGKLQQKITFGLLRGWKDSKIRKFVRR